MKQPVNRITRATLALAVVLTSHGAFAQSESAAAPTPPATETDQQLPDVPISDIRMLVEVFHKIKSDYVEAIDDKELLENAMRGMLAGLDPHSAFLDQGAYQNLQEGTSGEFGGLGIEVGIEDGFVKVISPIDDTPAMKAGVEAGDLIIRIDDAPVKGISIGDAVKLMRGKPGTDIVLTILREGVEKPLDIEITRAFIKIQSVRSRTLEPGYGYIRISQFQSRTGDDLRDHLRRLREANDPLKGLVVDLRNNPGGILGGAVSVSDAFLESGRIVYTEGRVTDSQLEFEAKPPDLIDGAPLIVLVNEGSASASEIVAGALQDRERALVMGRQTFGKGSVQTILPMNDERALKLTTARYYTPNGRSIQAEGITPDIIVSKARLTLSGDGEQRVVKEAHLSRHLDADEEPSDSDRAKAEREALAANDFELYEALNLLKGMALLEARAKK